MPNPTIVSAALNDEELRKSIVQLVSDYKNSLNDMKTYTTQIVGDIKNAIKSIGETKIDFSGTFDGMGEAKKKMASAASGGSGSSPASNPSKTSYASNTIGELEETIRLQEKARKNETLGTVELREQNKLIADNKTKLKEELMTEDELLKKRQKEADLQQKLSRAPLLKEFTTANSLPTKNITQLEEKLRRLQDVQSKMQNSRLFDEEQLNKVQVAIDRTSAAIKKQNDALDRQRAKMLKQVQSPYIKEFNAANTMSTRDLTLAEAKLQRLLAIQTKMRSTGLFDEARLNRVQNAIDNVRVKIERLRIKNPMSIRDVLGMDESSVDAIARKMQALKRVSIDPNNTAQVKQLGEEYQRLAKRQNEYLGKNLLIQKSNHMLASTFGYIRNRIIYAFTLGTLTQFLKDVRNIRAEYEMLDRSLGILVGDFEKGTQIFNELNEMALKSPFTLIELGTAAKQLTAYNFAANEVVDTTRRLADISAALGVPMERLTYNLGQIKAQGALTARDARDFANAGLAIVPMLADMYTKQKAFGKEMTTTADVYDMMSKKMVSYGDVLKVLQQITDEGGKFFNFQARQADTLKVQIANLSLAYNNMMNEIGADNQGLLTGSIRMVRSLFENWKTVANVIQQLIITFGAYKATAIVVTALNSRMFVGSILVNLRNYIRGIKAATGAMATFNAVTKLNPIGFLAAALASVAGYFLLFRDNVQEVSQEVEMFGESAAKSMNKVRTLQKILQGSANTSSTYKKTLSELSNVMSEYGVKLDAEKANRDEINKATEQTIQLIKEEAAERQRANNIAKGEENYNKGIKDAKDAFYSEISDISDLTDIGGQTKKFRKELEDNAQAISDVVATIVEENISLVVGKSGDEAAKGMLEIQEKVSGAMSSMGISSKATQYLLYNTDILRDLIVQTRKVSEEQLNYNNKIDSYYDAAKKATESTMTFTQKVEANARALQNTSNDALSLYNKIYDIVKIAQQNHTINFDLKLTADNPPKWMLDKSLPELQRLAQRFAAIAQSGGHVEGYDREGTYQQALRYASAARQKQEEAERAARMKNNTKTKKERDAILDTIKEEISLTKKLQGEYDKLTAKGASHADAIQDVRNRYANTIKLLDTELGKHGLPKFDTSIITGKDPNKQLEYFKNLREILNSRGMLNLDRSKVIDATIQELDVSAKTYNLDKVTKGLNSELGKLKDEYELALELDANPELGDMFADMFSIDTNTLPQTFGEALDRAQIIINRKLAELNVSSPFDLMQTDINEFANSAGLEKESEAIKELAKWQGTFRDMFKKNLVDSEKMLDDYIKKYGDYSDKVAEIEASRLEKLKKLNEAYYTEEMRKRPEYFAKLNAINQGAKKEEQQVDFDEFKNSRYYTMMFENLDYISTKTIRDMRDRVREYIDTAKDLTPEQLKTLISQYEKLEQKVVKRSPFKTLTKDLKNYLKTSGDRKAANEAFRNAQKEYNAQSKIVAALNKKYEQAKANTNTSQSYLDFLQIEINAQSDILDIFKEQLELAEKKADKYNLLAKLAKSEMLQVAQMVANNLKGLAELRDQMNELFGVDASKGETLLGHKIDGMIDGLAKASDGINKVISSAQSGNAFGVVGGVVDVFTGVGDAIASIFGDGSARTRRLNHEINESKETVRQLSMAYDDLERAVNKSLGTAETEARRAAIANKELQLTELERQKALEESKRSKDRDDDAIKQYEESIHSIKNEIADLKEEVVNNLWGDDVKSAAEAFVDTWVQAWRAGETTLDAIQEKMDDMILNLIKKAMTSKIVETLLNPLYSELDRMTKEGSEGGMALTTNELRQLATQAGVTAEEINTALGAFYGNLANLGIISPTEESKELSALQQGIQGITEDTAGALEAYMNGVSQQVYLQSDLLTQIRDAVVGFNLDVQVATMSQILLQLQSSYTVHLAIQGILEGWSSPSGLAVRVEMQ